MYQRLCNPLQSKSFFLFGPRGTGKTRLVRTLIPEEKCLWIDLLKEGELFSFSKNPNELRDRIRSHNGKPDWVVIDEVQRAAALLNEVHSFIEEHGLKFALTGSSARKLKRGGANLLAGRALLNHLFPLTYRELANDFVLSDALHYGTLPAVCNERDPKTRQQILLTYIEVYLREEIREEQIVRRLDPFARFLEAAAQSSGSIVNLSRLGREAGTDAKTITRYFQILEDTLLGFFLEPFHASVRKRQRQQAKFYLFDIGVRRALEGSLHIPVTPRTYEWGRTFEHLVLLEAYRLNSYLRTNYRFSYLRTQNQLEIDLILERRGDPTWCIEIKSASEIDPVEIRKIKALTESIKDSRSMILCATERRHIREGVEIFPWQEGLEKIFG